VLLVCASLFVPEAVADPGQLTFVEAESDGVGGVDGLYGAVTVAVSPDGAHVYATGRYDNAVAVFSRNATTGELTFVEAQFQGVGGVSGLNDPYSLAVSPDGAHVYATGNLSDSVAVFSRNVTTGTLTFVEAQFDGVGGVNGLWRAAGVDVSPDGAHVYVTAMLDDAVAVFSRNATTGELTFVEAQFDGVGGVEGIDEVWEVTVSPDGAHVYVGAIIDDAVAAFSRNATTGELTFVEAEFDGVGGVQGLGSGGIRFMAMSPEGTHLYIANADENAVAVFSRNASTGELTFVEAQFDGVGGVDGLGGCFGVGVSPDGSNVYAVASATYDIDDAIAVFSRDTETGELTFIEAHFDGVGGVSGLDGGVTVALSPAGDHVYVACIDDSSVAVFSRQVSSPVPTASLVALGVLSLALLGIASRRLRVR